MTRRLLRPGIRAWQILLGRTILAGVSATLIASTSFAASVEMRVVGYPTEVEGLSSFYVRVDIANHGTHPLRPCETSQDDASASETCVTVAYRKDKRPPRFAFSRVEVVPVLPTIVRVAPGETVERTVRIPTPDQGGAYLVYLYLITGEAKQLIWKEVPIRVHIKRRAPEATQRIWVVRALLALYGLGIGGTLYWAMRASDTTRER